ncbi:hypothetical protein V8C86DRAFT_244068 [Haematococcus lacustris]
MQSGVQLSPRSLLVSLDIGTHGSGFAFATRTAGEGLTVVRLHDPWPGQQNSYPKTRSALLYDGQTPIAWGDAALRKWENLGQAADQDMSQYHLLTDFKLALHDPDLAAGWPRGLTPKRVMTDFLKYLYSYTMVQLKEKVGAAAAHPRNIQWCLTVPAMWSEQSKASMRRAAHLAGLVDSKALTIILEPEAAALHALVEQVPPLKPGMSMMVLDVGGGTADATVHKCKALGGQAVLSEAACAEGVLCGSVYVDKEFRSFYRNAVGVDAFDTWAARNPATLQNEVMKRWEAVKCSFGDSFGPSLADRLACLGLDSDGYEESATYRVPIPRDLIKLMTRDQKASLWQRQSEISELELSSAEMRAIFKEPVEEVCRLAVRQLNAARRIEGGGPCSMVLLVGGFARSSYLEAKVRAAVRGLAGKVVVPPGCHTAVMAGAVQYGFNPALIHARRSRMAYGVKTCTQWTEGAPGKFWHQEKCEYMTNCKFLRFVEKDELVAHDQDVVHYLKPLYKTSEEVGMKLFACDDNAMEFVEDGTKGMQPLTPIPLTVQVPEYSDTADRQVCLKFSFGLTEIRVSALNKATGSSDEKIIPFPQDKAASPSA